MPNSANVMPQLSPAEAGRTITAATLDASKVTVAPASQVTDGTGRPPAPFVVSAVAGAPTSALANLVRFTALGSPNIQRDYQVALNAAAPPSGYVARGRIGLWLPRNNALGMLDSSGLGHDAITRKSAGYGLDPVYHAPGGGQGAFMEMTYSSMVADGQQFGNGPCSLCVTFKYKNTFNAIIGFSQAAATGTGVGTLTLDGTGKLQFISYSVSVGGPVTIQGGTVIDPDTTYNVQIVADGTDAKMYLNGVLDGQVLGCGNLYSPAARLNWGVDTEAAPTAGNPVGGYVGETVTYNVALTGPELATNYANAKTSYPDLP